MKDGASKSMLVILEFKAVLKTLATILNLFLPICKQDK